MTISQEAELEEQKERQDSCPRHYQHTLLLTASMPATSLNYYYLHCACLLIIGLQRDFQTGILFFFFFFQMGIFVTQWRSEFPGQSIRASRGQASCPSSDCGRCAQTLHQFLWPVSVRFPVNPGHRSLPELQERTTQLHTPTALPCSDDSLLLFSSTFSLQPKQDHRGMAYP